MERAIYLPPFGSFGDVHAMVDLAVTAEEAGWDGFYLWDHVLFEDDVPFVDAWITLAAIASATSRIRIGPLVTPLARRRPWKVAREAVTLDHLSHGRLVLGVGLGIDFWREFSAFGEPATDDRIRAALVDDGIDIITKLWSGEPATHHGSRLSVEGARFLPRPVQEPRIPIWAAALWPPKHEGPIRRAARCDGVMPFSGAPFTPEEAAEVRERVGTARGDDDFELCVFGMPDDADAFEAAGVTTLVLSFLHDEPLADVRAEIAAGPS